MFTGNEKTVILLLWYVVLEDWKLYYHKMAKICDWN